ncbi:hypothetical protein FH966_13305 [Lentibacillus cibarius]|uniref:Uncharacterized protein n=1 Tax=Lentibacillus cibarius TaxID=2583219 RepID=A0A549YL32_9BACI|nr:hypothetical protein [Lentibacillus cibarius]TRM12596.1 hypothetical protein FH966_13305 [Lentibacillus cibarius]
MTEETKEYDDQAKDLRELLQEVEHAEIQDDRSESENANNLSNDEEDEGVNDTKKQGEGNVNILELPPRKEVHTENKKGIRFKMNSITIRLLTVIFIIVLLIGGAFFLWGEELVEFIKNM